MPTSESDEGSDVEEHLCGTHVSILLCHIIYMHDNLILKHNLSCNAGGKTAHGLSKKHVCDIQMQSVTNVSPCMFVDVGQKISRHT